MKKKREIKPFAYSVKKLMLKIAEGDSNEFLR